MILNLAAQPRKTVRKSDLTKLRADGMIPAVLYGTEMESTSISVSQSEFIRCYKKSFEELTFYEIELEGKKYHTILKDKLIHPVSRQFLHIDFLVIPATAEMEFDVPIRFEGEPAGVLEGGFADIIQRSVKLVCQASNVPQLELDISGLNVGDSLRVGDLPKGNWTYRDDDDVALIVMHAKRVEEEEEVDEEAADEAAADGEAAPETDETQE